MSLKTYFLFLLVMAGVTYLVRALPFALVNKKITNKFVKSFLAYVPYTVLSAMTVPAIFTATGSLLAGTIAFVVAILVSLRGKGLVQVAIWACFAAFIVCSFIQYF